jgi:hypothetical protein
MGNRQFRSGPPFPVTVTDSVNDTRAFSVPRIRYSAATSKRAVRWVTYSESLASLVKSGPDTTRTPDTDVALSSCVELACPVSSFRIRSWYGMARAARRAFSWNERSAGPSPSR